MTKAFGTVQIEDRSRIVQHQHLGRGYFCSEFVKKAETEFLLWMSYS